MKQITAITKPFPRVFLMAIAVMQIALCASCSNTESLNGHSRHNVVALLDKAESLLGTDDSTALATLNSINSTTIRGRKQNARYALLYSEALYKNYIAAPNDSLIMTAVRYYSSTNDTEHQFRAFYILGCIYDELGQTTDAAVALGQAEQLADKISDDYRLGLLNTAIGNIFFGSFDFDRAAQYYRLAQDHYLAAGKEHHAIHAQYDIGRCLLETNDELMAHDIFHEVQELSYAISDWVLLYNSLCSQLSASLILNNMARATAEVDTLVKIFGIPETDPFAMSCFANYYIKTGLYTDAERIIESAWEKSQTESDSIKLLLCESLLAELRGDHQIAFQKFEQSIYLQHRNLYLLQHKPALGAIKEYYKEVAHVESLIISRKQVTIVLLSLCFVLFVVALMTLSRYRKVKSEARLSELNVVIDNLRLKEDTSNSTINELNHRINTLFGSTYAKLDGIFAELIESEKQLEAYDNRAGKKDTKHGMKLQGELYNRIRSSFDEFVSDEYQTYLDGIINSIYNGLAERLSSINLKKRDLQILRLSIAGFSPKTISYILGIPIKTLYQNRSRILNKIAENAPRDHELISNTLNIRHITK